MSEPHHDSGEWARTARDELKSHVDQAIDQFDQVNEKIKARTGRDLIMAIVFGATIGLAVIASLIWAPALFSIVIAVAAVAGVSELALAFRQSGRRIDLIPQIVGALGMIAAATFGPTWLAWLGLFAGVALVIVWRLLTQMITSDGRTYGAVLIDVLIGAFIQVYVPFLLTFAVLIVRGDHGNLWLIGMIVTVVATDTAAYATGLTFGKHKMVPRISPNKTWEGFAGAALAAMLAGVLFTHFALGVPVWAGLVFGLVLLITATVGDLAESMIKRDMGVKDMSSWFPGHGGVLDRLDSLLFSLVATYALMQVLNPLIGTA